MSLKLFSFDSSPYPFSTYRSQYTVQYDENDAKEGENAMENSIKSDSYEEEKDHLSKVLHLQSRLNPHFGVIPREKLLYTFKHVYTDTSEYIASRLFKYCSFLKFSDRIIETNVYISTHRCIVTKENISGTFRRRSEQQEFLQNVKRIELHNETYPNWWFNFVSPFKKVILIVFGMWLPLAWDFSILLLSLIMSIFLQNLTPVGVITPLCILSSIALISRVFQGIFISVSLLLYYLKSNPPKQAHERHSQAKQESISNDSLKVSHHTRYNKDSSNHTKEELEAQGQEKEGKTVVTSGLPQLMHAPILYIIALVVSLLFNVLTFALTFIGFASPLASTILVFIFTSFSTFSYLLSLGFMPKVSRRYPTTMRIYFANVSSNKLSPLPKLSHAEAYNQALLVCTIIGFIIGWIPGSLLLGFLYILISRAPENVGFFKEQNDRVLTFTLSYMDAQKLKTTLWRLKINDIRYYEDEG